MVKAIAAQLESLINNDTEFIKLNQADSYWQEKINKAVIDSTDSTYLVFPQTVNALSAIVKQAQQHQWRILICGSGSKLDWGGLTENIQLVVSTQKCDRLIEHAVGDLTVTVEAGKKLNDVQKQLRKHNQFLAIDPAFSESATIGGIVATADTGSWRQRYGGIRDMLLGISFVRADGEVAKAGGRVVKNVAGYDLMKLFTGAYGTLGIISQATFRTYPLPEASKTILLTGKADKIAEVTQAIRNSGLTPTALDLLSKSVIQRFGIGQDIGLIIRWQTIPKSIAQQLSQVKALAQQSNLTVQDYQDRDEIDLWQRLAETIRIPGNESSIIAKIGIAPNAAVNLMQQLNVETLATIHAGIGIGQLQLENDDVKAITKLRSLCQQNQGFLTVLTAPNEIKQKLDIYGYKGNAVNAMQTIKNQFDSQNIFNPSRFIGSI